MILALLAIVSSFLNIGASTSATATCFGPCHIPGCPNSTFWVCHETPGQTVVTYENGGVKGQSTQENSATFDVPVGGAMVGPKADKNWGGVQECSDLEGWC